MRKHIRYRPIDRYPQSRTDNPRSSPFRASWSDTEYYLLDEASRLDGLDPTEWTEVVIALDCDESGIRVDAAGLKQGARLRSDAVVIHVPAVEVAFPCDTFVGWRANVRAVALTMEKLRAIERYGVARNGQQYAGWKQLGAGDGAIVAGAALTLNQARDVVADVLGITAAAVQEDPRWARRAALKATHPDTGDQPEKWEQTRAAVSVLERSPNA